MPGKRSIYFLAFFFAFAIPARPATQWIKINSAHFELFTSAGERKGREAILYFEQVRSLFETLTNSTGGSILPVRIIAFQSEQEFSPYRPYETAAAFYMGAWDRDYLVMESIAPEFYHVAIQAYVHLIVRHSGLKLPVWFDEGLAELYSPLKPVGKQVRFGDILPGVFTS